MTSINSNGMLQICGNEPSQPSSGSNHQTFFF
jgi:hypothetical protein